MMWQQYDMPVHVLLTNGPIATRHEHLARDNLAVWNTEEPCRKFGCTGDNLANVHCSCFVWEVYHGLSVGLFCCNVVVIDGSSE